MKETHTGSNPVCEDKRQGEMKYFLLLLLFNSKVRIFVTTMKRFFDKIEKIDSCWIWTACLRGKTGYGAFKLNGKTIDAHRVSYQLHKGEIPEKMYVCHSCDNRKCVNPDHLFLGTAKDNWQDGFDKNRIKLLGGIDIEKLKRHPSISSYAKGCRCQQCKIIKSNCMKKYRNKLRQNNNTSLTKTMTNK